MNTKNHNSRRPPTPTPEAGSQAEILRVGAEDVGRRLDVFCANHLAALSRNQIQKANADGRLRVDGVVRPDHYALSDGEEVRLEPAPRPAGSGQPLAQDIAVSLVYEDDDIVVVNKPAGMVVHPAHGNEEGTLVNALLGRGTRLSALGGGDRPGIVHRLDKDTSGVMVVAKTDEAYASLGRQMKGREIRKVYHALAWGRLGKTLQTIDAPIARHAVQRQRMAVARRGGRAAVTEVFVVDTFEHFDYIRVVPLTGRTHQIRVHLAHISHPILGDSVYGGRRQRGHASSARERDRLAAIRKLMPRQALHASILSFVHPTSGRHMTFRTALPDDMRRVLEQLHRGD